MRWSVCLQTSRRCWRRSDGDGGRWRDPESTTLRMRGSWLSYEGDLQPEQSVHRRWK